MAAKKKIERPRITVLALPLRWHAPGTHLGNPNWELRTWYSDDLIAEVEHDGAHYFPYVPGAHLPTIDNFFTVAECKLYIETFLTDPIHFKEFSS